MIHNLVPPAVKIESKQTEKSYQLAKSLIIKCAKNENHSLKTILMGTQFIY